MNKETSSTKCLSLNELFLIEPIFWNCFVCGDKRYCEFYFQNHLYRVCVICLKKENVKEFFSK